MRKDQDAVPLTDERETAMKEDGMDIELNEGRELVHRVAKEWVRGAELVPVRHLSLDLAEPINGWESRPCSSAASRSSRMTWVGRASAARCSAICCVKSVSAWPGSRLRVPHVPLLRWRPSPPASLPSRTARRWRRSWPTIPPTGRRRPSSEGRLRDS